MADVDNPLSLTGTASGADTTGDQRWAVAVHNFARAILHGDEEHRAWLLDAADAFVDGRALPPPRGNEP